LILRLYNFLRYNYRSSSGIIFSMQRYKKQIDHAFAIFFKLY
jgi:hypothetical protein